MGNPEGKRPLGRPKRRWEDRIKMHMRVVGCDPGDWIALAEDRDHWRAYVRAVMNIRIPEVLLVNYTQYVINILNNNERL